MPDLHHGLLVAPGASLSFSPEVKLCPELMNPSGCGMLILVLGIVGYAILCFLALMWLIGVRVQLSIIGLGCQPCSDS